MDMQQIMKVAGAIHYFSKLSVTWFFVACSLIGFGDSKEPKFGRHGIRSGTSADPCGIGRIEIFGSKEEVA
jgi:hypothetical protein